MVFDVFQGKAMADKDEQLDFNAINAEIGALFEKIGRVVVLSEQLRHQLVDAVAMAEANQPVSDQEWSTLNARLRAKFQDSSLTKVVDRFGRALLSRYADQDSQSIVCDVCEKCRILIARRNDVTHSLWSIGWRINETKASSQSFRFQRTQSSFQDLQLGSSLDEIIDQFRSIIHTVNKCFWATFRGEPLKQEQAPPWHLGTA
jgi:hypothetical protein